jgi:hypothetical protein
MILRTMGCILVIMGCGLGLGMMEGRSTLVRRKRLDTEFFWGWEMVWGMDAEFAIWLVVLCFGCWDGGVVREVRCGFSWDLMDSTWWGSSTFLVGIGRWNYQIWLRT